jgi:O-methyltransferase domain
MPRGLMSVNALATVRSTEEGPPPHVVLVDLACGAYVPRCLQVLAALGVADALPTQGTHVVALATTVLADPDALLRMLRAVAAHGVFGLDDTFVTHTEASLLLRGDHPRSVGAFVKMMGASSLVEAALRLDRTVLTGRPAMSDLDPGGWFGYLDQHPEERALFDRAMEAKSIGDMEAVLAAYDFSSFGTVVDVGGGEGHLVEAIADANIGVSTVLIDLPGVIERVSQRRGEHRGVRRVGADFFTDRLPSGDLYVLMEVLHDWPDADLVRILLNIAASAPAHARLLIVEMVMPEGPGPHPAKVRDLVMLTATGGRERTASEFSLLLRQAGFLLQRVIPADGGYALVEAERVS